MTSIEQLGSVVVHEAAIIDGVPTAEVYVTLVREVGEDVVIPDEQLVPASIYPRGTL
jgi:hypothetical protein